MGAFRSRGFSPARKGGHQSYSFEEWNLANKLNDVAVDSSRSLQKERSLPSTWTAATQDPKWRTQLSCA